MATLKDIAVLTKVSTSTISRVINQDPTLSITSTKRDEILQAVKELDYVSPKQRKAQQENDIPSFSGSCVTASAQLEVVIVNFLDPVREISDPYFTSIRVGIESCCFKNKIAVRTLRRDQIEKSGHILSKPKAVIAVGHFTDDEINQMYRYNRNLIFIDSNPLGRHSDAVLFDRHAAARELVGYIIDSGARYPAFIGNDETRLHVFREQTKLHNLYREEHCIVSKEFCIESGYKAMLKILESPQIPDVVFAATDIIAVGVYRAIYEKELTIPGDIKVIGMNDISTSAHMNPGLSTMRLYPMEMGETAVELFLELVNGRKVKKMIHLGYDFIQRDSFSL
ncbi:LacI family transcriptional regulator [Vibrio sp. HA2012]|uniref:LacI family DNA-binding transcriptional regulator n=1 Tax=Vibrio sp. HA2012 TaxID=1971595 RepID=UPI000C2BB143|nr:LacI family DNA-binding transcriptional regulator [Vibrio sp. HA2012]PJC87167.1 LacI family transcriptional regulator [Vibrio sp. HA2012]